MIIYKHAHLQLDIGQGDAGGPIIQYVTGRAVLVGTIWGDQVNMAHEANCVYNATSISAFVRVSRKVDWILEVWNGWVDARDQSVTTEVTTEVTAEAEEPTLLSTVDYVA